MKFTVDIGGQREEIEVQRRREARPGAAGEEGQALSVLWNGQRVDVRVVHRDGAHFVLEVEDGAGTRRRLRAAGHSDGAARQLWVNGSLVHYTVSTEGDGGAGSDGAGAAGAGGLSASIPAVVSEILVSVGEQVSAGQKLILLESMKMILPIQAPHDGTVRALHCAVGDAVQPGVVLVTVEAEAEN